VRIMAGRSRGPDEKTRAGPEPGSEADELTAELSAFYWQAYDRRLAETGFGAIARQLPGLIAHAIRLGWEANRRDTVATIALNLVSGVLTGFALLATQWQRIAAARGFYRTAPLLVMDEPTAALDARAEYALFSSIHGHAAGRGVLLITHRLASVRHADRIYVLRDGRVIEQGVHADLIALGGQYAELFTLQASQYDGVRLGGDA
jgi:ATPase subunit of ABC transporter with duplicated ATPase domains